LRERARAPTVTPPQGGRGKPQVRVLMKITWKLVLVVLASTALVLSVDGYLRVRHELIDFRADMIDELQTLGRVLERLLTDAWRSGGQQRVMQLIADTNGTTDRIDIRWIEPDKIAAAAEPLSLVEAQSARLLQGEAITIWGRNALGALTLFQYAPIRGPNGTLGVVELSESLAPMHAYARRTVLRTLGLWAGLVGLSGCLLFMIGLVMIGRPMRDIMEKTRRVGGGDLEGPLRLRARDEFAEIAEALNQMCDQLQASQARAHAEMTARIATLEQLRHADRLKTVGSLASGLAHELGTPLNVISGRANLITSGQLGPEDVAKSAHIIKEQVQHMATIIRQVLDFTRRKSPQRTRMDLRSLAQQSLDMIAPLAEQHQAVLVFRASPQAIHVCIEPEQIEQVIVNLITNAWQAMPQGGQIEVEVQQQDRRPPMGLDLATAPYACLMVADQGEGIREEDLLHIFDPFFTTKGTGQGTGLGLSITYGIVHDHEGWIEVANRCGGGACFRVYLPIEDEPCLDAF
jgi:two-component system NtrC family sensor kinase